MKAHHLRAIRWFGLATFTVVLLSICGVIFVVCREPVLQGRPGTVWIRDLSRANGARDVAVQMFRHEGAHAVPALVSAIDRRRSAFASWLQRLPFHDSMPKRIKEWVHQRTTIQDMDRAWAIRMCAIIGPDARGSHRALQRALSDDSAFVRGDAAMALAQTQAEPASALPMIATLLEDPAPTARSKAAIALGVYGQAARPFIAKLQTLTNDSEMKVAFSARLAVAMLETPDRVASKTNESGEISYSLKP